MGTTSDVVPILTSSLQAKRRALDNDAREIFHDMFDGQNLEG